MAVSLAMLITLLMATVVQLFLTSPQYLPYSNQPVSVSEGADGYVLLTFDEGVSGYDINVSRTEEGKQTHYHITTWTNLLSEITERPTLHPVVLNVEGGPVSGIYYYQTNGEVNQLIYGNVVPNQRGVMTLPRLFLNAYLRLAVCSLFMCLILVFIVRHHPKLRYRMCLITFLPLSYMMGHGLVMGVRTSSYSPQRDLIGILLSASFIYGIMFIVTKLYRKHAKKSG